MSAPVEGTTDQVFRPHVGIHLILLDQGKVLLLQRANTGFADGFWSVPGGCLDEGETLPAGAAREAREEVGIVIDPADLDLVHLCHHSDPDGQARIGVFFAATRWIGQPVNAEPGKCAKIDWFDPTDLPHDIVTYVRVGITAHLHGQTFSLNGWTSDMAEALSPSGSSALSARPQAPSQIAARAVRSSEDSCQDDGDVDA